jgi:hypothetical protein
VLTGLIDGPQQVKWAITKVEEFAAPSGRESGAKATRGDPRPG